jgi:ribose transport system permease protein
LNEDWALHAVRSVRDVPKSHAQSSGVQARLRRHAEEILLAGIIAALLALSPLFSPVFFNAYNIATLSRQISFNVMPTLGQLIVILTGGIDLSIGAVMRSAQLISILVVGQGYGVLATCIAALSAGLLIGLANGLVVTVGRLEPFIVTLGTWSILDGLTLVLTNGRGVAAKAPAAFTSLGRGFLGGVPYPVIITAIVTVIFAVLIHGSVFGRMVFSVGDNDVAAHYSGIRINRIKVAVFSLSGGVAALTGFLLAARTGGFQPTTISAGGAGTELATIAAVVVGGARLSGGRGTVIGAVLGAVLTGLLFNLLVLAGIDPYVQALTLGLIILGALLLSTSRRKGDLR